jgi:hypothetical protein
MLPLLTTITLDCFLPGSYDLLALYCHWPLCLMPVMMVAGLYNFTTSSGKLMASHQVFIAISRICIIGLGLLDVLPIGTTIKQNKKTNQIAN